MILREFLKNNQLIANTHDIFEYDTLKARFIVRYGNQEIRHDLTAEEITVAAQNVIDINETYFRYIFSDVINPYATWKETDTHNDSGTADKTTSNTGEAITKHEGTITRADTGTVTNSATGENKTSGTTHNDNPTTSTTLNNVNAYNATTAVPRDNSNTTNTNTSDGTYSDTANSTNNNTQTLDTTNTQTNNNTDTTNTTNGGTENSTHANSGGYTKSGFNVSDYITANRAYLAAYDVIVDYVAREILVTVIDWGC